MALANNQNTGKVKFDPPSVPVIFVLGNENKNSLRAMPLYFIKHTAHSAFVQFFFLCDSFRFNVHDFCIDVNRLLVSGGPGSGKVTHCDTLMEEKRGVTHINMMDLLHQHVISNGTYTFN